MRIPRAFPALVCLSVSLLAGEVRTYGKALKTKEETRISDILATPEKYKGKTVKVRGIVTNVCDERGCYINVKGDKKFQEIMVKVEDGVIVFPMDALGREAVAEGVVDVYTLSVEEQKEMCPVEAKALNRKFDPKKITGPMKVVRINGVGAEVRK